MWPSNGPTPTSQPMLLTMLAGGFRHASHSFRALIPIPCRTLFYPSAPPSSLDSSNDAKFPPEVRAHLSQEQFSSVRNSRGTQFFSQEYWGGIIPDNRNEIKLGGSTPAEIWEQSSTRFAEIQQEPTGIHWGTQIIIHSLIFLTEIRYQEELLLLGKVTT